MTEPITDLEMDWATVSTQQIVATLRALVPLCSPDRNMELVAEAANRLEADHQATDTITALRAEVEALRGASPTMLTAFLTTVSSNGKYIWYEFARAAPKGGDHG